MSYQMSRPMQHSTHLAPGEKIDMENKNMPAQVLEEGEVPKAYSEWESALPPQEKVVILMFDLYKATIIVPTKWEYRNG